MHAVREFKIVDKPTNPKGVELSQLIVKFFY